MSSTKNTRAKTRPFLSRFIRWHGVVPLVCAAVLGAAYLDFLFDNNVKSLLERQATALNGAAVNIGSLHTNFLKRTIDIDDIQIGHPTQPMRNLLQLDHVQLNFSLEPLLRKKILFPKVLISGVHYYNRRDTSGLQPFDMDAPAPPPSFLDRVASGLYGSIRNELSENPLRHLGPLSTGLDLKAKIESMHNDLKSVQELKQIRQKLEDSETKWNAATRDIPSSTTIEHYRKQLAALASGEASTAGAPVPSELAKAITADYTATNQTAKDIETQVDALSQDLSKLDPYIDEDAATIRKSLDLPRTDLDDLTPLVFGPKILSYLERISYWLDLSRREMPVGTKNGPDLLVIVPTDWGSAVHFGRLAGSPSFLMNHIEIHSQPNPHDPTQGTVEGTLKGLTLDPTIYGHPTTIKLTADFPKDGILGLKFEGQIDHVKETPHEEFHFSVGSLKVEDWRITKSEDFQFSIAKANANLQADGDFDDTHVLVSWKTAFDNVDYGIKSRYKQTEDLLKELVAGIYNFNLSGKIGGPVSNLQFTAESDLGRQLAQAFRHEFRHELSAIDDTLRTQIVDEIAPDKDDLLVKFEEARQKVLAPVELARSELNEIAELSEKTLGRPASQPQGRARRHKRRG